MKRLCCIALVVLFLSSLVYAQSVSTSELKSTLIDAIKDYLSSQTPKLTVDELKDLIVVYLQTQGDTIDLSGNGKYSGQKLIDVYNKFKGVTQGEYYDELVNAVRLDKNSFPSLPNYYGYFDKFCRDQSLMYPIPQKGPVWFLIDPKTVVGSSKGSVGITVQDCAQGGPKGNLLSAFLYRVDRNGNLIPGKGVSIQCGNLCAINPLGIGMDVNQRTIGLDSCNQGKDEGLSDDSVILVKLEYVQCYDAAVPTQIFWVSGGC